MKKKFLVITMLIVLISLLASCGDSENRNSPGDSSIQNSDASGDDTGSDYPALQLPDNIDSFQVQIQDQVYSLPIKYTDFISKGWKIDERYEDASAKVGSGERDLVWFINGDYRVNCNLYNPDISEQVYEKCVISGIQIDLRFESKGLTVFLPGGLKLGEVYKEQVVSAYREADDKYEASSSSKLTWETKNIWSNVAITFDVNGVAVGYNGENPITLEDFEYSDPVVNDIIYQAPEKLGANIEDRTVMFGGDLYSLPAPLSAFIENGWETSEANQTVSGNGILHVNLKRNGTEIRLTVNNYSENGCTASAAYVEKLSSNDLYSTLFAVAEGINTDTTEVDLLNYLQEYSLPYEKTQGASGNKYSIQLEGDEWNNYCVISYSVDKVGYITISSGEKKEATID